MKLLRLHIANFGKLNNMSVDFSHGCNIFCRENGWGKTTLTRFIKVMFYGFDGERSKALKDRERNRYMPWQGGVYGGEIVFEVQGRAYMLRREFGRKPADDSYDLYNADTMTESEDFPENIGETLFHMDADAFMNTIYIGENGCDMEITGSMTAVMTGSDMDISGIGGYADRDVARYDMADKRLKDAINKLSPTRATGMLYKKKQDVTSMEASLRQMSDIENRIAEGEAHIERLNNQLMDAKLAYKTAVGADDIRRRGDEKKGSYNVEVHDRNAKEHDRNMKEHGRNAGNDKETGAAVIMWLLAIIMFVTGTVMIIMGRNSGAAPLVVGIVLVFINVIERRRNNSAYPQEENVQTAHEEDILPEEYLENVESLREEVFQEKATLLKLKEKKTELDRLTGKLELIKAEYEKGLHKYKLLKECRTALKEAREKYTLSYSTPLLRAFLRYMDMFDRCYKDRLNGTFIIDGENNINLMSDGAKRDIEALSRGYRDMTGLAARLGCVDVMFNGEKPFIILDDPFAGFDDRHVELGHELLNMLGDQYQILYFTCSKNRA